MSGDATRKSDSGWLMRGEAGWLLLLAALYLAIVLPAIPLAGAGNDFDETNYHYPAVLQIRSHWPRLDLVKDCLSPIAPGYHYFLAGCSFVTGSDLIRVRLINAAVSLPIPLVLFIWLRAYLVPRLAFLFTLPLALDCFFLKASCRVVTDNASFLLVLCTLLAIFRLPASGWKGTLGGVTAALGVCVRQLTLPLFLVLWVQLLNERLGLLRDTPFGEKPTASRSYLAAGLSRLLPLVVLAILFSAWHGLVAPQWSHISSTLSLAPLAFLMSLAGILAFPFLLSLNEGLPSLLKRTGRWVVWGLVAGFGAALVSPTSWSASEGRWGGWLWLLVKYAPAVDNRSLLLLALAPIGGVLIVVFARELWQRGQQRSCLLWLSSLVAWAISYAVSTNIYHHYFEPQLVVFFAVATAMLYKSSTARRVSIWPILLFLAYDLSLDVIEIFGPTLFHFRVQAP